MYSNRKDLDLLTDQLNLWNKEKSFRLPFPLYPGPGMLGLKLNYLLYLKQLKYAQWYGRESEILIQSRSGGSFPCYDVHDETKHTWLLSHVTGGAYKTIKQQVLSIYIKNTDRKSKKKKAVWDMHQERSNARDVVWASANRDPTHYQPYCTVRVKPRAHNTTTKMR